MSEKEPRVLAELIGQLKKMGAEDGKGRFEEMLYGEKLMKSLPPIKTIDDTWFVYEKGAWLERRSGMYRRRALDICPKQYRKDRNAQNVLAYIETHAQLEVNRVGDAFCGVYQALPDHSILINAANGVVKIWPGGEVTLEKHSPDYGFTACTSAAYDEKAACPLFLRVLAEALPDEQDQELQQVFAGLLLHPSPNYETCLISYGDTGTGKSTIAEAIVHCLQAKEVDGTLVTSLSLNNLCDSKSYSLPKLRFAAVNLATELDAIKLDESTNFKQVVSGETIEVRGIYAKPESIRTSVKLWFLANTLPRFKNGTGAELRRMRFLRFEQTPAYRDTTIKERLPQERDGIFLWMIEGLVKLIQHGSVPHGGAVSRGIVETFEVSNDPVGAFVARRCVLDREATVPKSYLTTQFKDFLQEYGLPEEFETWFYRRLYERFSGVKAIKKSYYESEDERLLRGLRIKTQAELEQEIKS